MIAVVTLMMMLRMVKKMTMNSWLIGGILFHMNLAKYLIIEDSMTTKAQKSALIFLMNDTM